uniref:Agamous-like MADS-box protein AGL62 n=1 Tax=Aegilops tauschii TaxID=37682 RepID=M8CJ54_AEGTA
MAAPNRRGGSGRKKTVIRRIEQEDARYVCYSKRRMGLFTKATDLAVLTGAQVAALAFSPTGRAFSFGHPSVDSVVERFLAGEAAGAAAREEGAADDRLLAGEGAGEGAAGEDKKLENLLQEFNELRTELAEVKKWTKRTDKAMAKERSAGDQIAAWFDPKVRDMGDEDMAAFFAALMQEQGFEAGMDMQQMVMAALPPSQVVAAGVDMQEMPPPPGLAAGMDMEQMQMTMPKPPGFDAGLDMEIDQWLNVMLPPPEIPAGMETVQQGLHQPNAGFPY